MLKNKILETLDSTIKESLTKDKKILELETKIVSLKGEIESYSRKLDNAKKKKEWEIEKACNEAVKETEEKLVDANLARIDSEARFETYEKFDSKTDRDKAQDNLATLIAGLAKMIEAPSVQPDVHIHATK